MFFQKADNRGKRQIFQGYSPPHKPHPKTDYRSLPYSYIRSSSPSDVTLHFQINVSYWDPHPIKNYRGRLSSSRTAPDMDHPSYKTEGRE